MTLLDLHLRQIKLLEAFDIKKGLVCQQDVSCASSRRLIVESQALEVISRINDNKDVEILCEISNVVVIFKCCCVVLRMFLSHFVSIQATKLRTTLQPVRLMVLRDIKYFFG